MKTNLCWLIVASLALNACGKKADEAEKAVEPVISVEVAAAKSQSVRDLLPIDGSFVLPANDFAKLSPVAPGKLVTVLVKEGDRVHRGQLLAKIDTRVLDAQRSSASAGSAAAQAQANQSESSLKAARADFEATVRSADLNLQAVMAEQNSNIDQAKIELDRLHAGARPQEVSQAQQSVRQAQVNRDKAYADAERDKKLLAEGYVSGQQADASRAAYDVADSALIQAKDQLQLVKLGARPEELKASESRLKSARDLGAKRIEAARASLDQARKSKLSLDAKAQETNAARLNALGKSSDSAAAAALAANGEIRAPFDGVVVKRMIGFGTAVDSTTVVIELVKRGAHVEFLGQVSPKIASQLSENMPVSSKEDLGPSGGILSVGVADTATGQVPVRIFFPVPPGGVVAGSFARVFVQLRKIPDAITVPETAVLTREDKRVVFVIVSGVAKMHEVEVGPVDSGNIAIAKGVKRGDKVVLLGNHELSDGAKVEEAKKEDPAKADDKKDEKPGAKD